MSRSQPTDKALHDIETMVSMLTIDRKLNWTDNDILSEFNSKVRMLSASLTVPVPFSEIKSRDLPKGKNPKKDLRYSLEDSEDVRKKNRDHRGNSATDISRRDIKDMKDERKRNQDQRANPAFVMNVSWSDMEDSEDEGNQCQAQSLVAGRRFCCDDLYLSDNSEDELDLGTQNELMDRGGLTERAFSELNHEYQLGTMEEIRSIVSAVQTEQMSLSENFTSALERTEKYVGARREVERKHDAQYRRVIAEAIDNHLTAIQRDHELRSQIEERKISAAYEEAKRKEKMMQEEKLRQEKAKLEAEAKLQAEKAKRAIEEQRKAAKEAAEREAIESSKNISATQVKEGPAETLSEAKLGSLSSKTGGRGSEDLKKPQAEDDTVRASKHALGVEQGRLSKLKELDEKNKTLKSSSNMDFGSVEKLIYRSIKQISGFRDSANTKAGQILRVLKDPNCPESIGIGIFAEKFVSRGAEAPDKVPFPYCYVTVLVTSQVPHAMDIVLAEFHKACIYTVPKHILYSKSAFKSKMDYCKALGFRVIDGELESVDDYLKRLKSYMRLYGALVQTQVEGVQNKHGLEEGWVWLARFLNALPANIFTATALHSFLQVAGFALFRKYKSQFVKLLNVINNEFLDALKAQGDIKLNPIIYNIVSYLEGKEYLQEPKDRNLRTSLDSQNVPLWSEW